MLLLMALRIRGTLLSSVGTVWLHVILNRNRYGLASIKARTPGNAHLGSGHVLAARALK